MQQGRTCFSFRLCYGCKNQCKVNIYSLVWATLFYVWCVVILSRQRIALAFMPHVVTCLWESVCNLLLWLCPIPVNLLFSVCLSDSYKIPFYQNLFLGFGKYCNVIADFWFSHQTGSKTPDLIPAYPPPFGACTCINFLFCVSAFGAAQNGKSEAERWKRSFD